MKKSIISLFAIVALSSFSVNATIHEIRVWNGYFKFLPNSLTIQLGDTIQWLPFDSPTMTHTITSTNIPTGATTFDQIWKLPADTFFQYIPQHIGTYDYVCTPHEISYNMIGSFTVQGTTSLEEKATTSKPVTLYPNPVANRLHVLNATKGQQFDIFNLNGKKVLESNLQTINVSNLSNGVYFLRQNGKEAKLLKFIVSD
jgi:plastocyanin